MSHPNAEYQQAFWNVESPHRIVNVASVPKRSPFRYPGGKTWLVPRVREWLRSQNHRPGLLIEPFAGGATVGLTAAFESLAEHVLLVELDKEVAAVWKTILQLDAEWLVDRILSFNLTHDNVRTELAGTGGSAPEIAFRTILKNRTFHGGILAPGSSLMKNGESGKGLHSRWYPATLASRIRAIANIRDRFTFHEGDGVQVIREHAHLAQNVFFIDPPYTAGTQAGKRAGSRLYTHHRLDHEQLFGAVQKVKGDFLMTYDDAVDVHELAEKHKFQTRLIAMKNTHHAKMTELLIGRSLAWVG
jgi:DNA adenine methylase